MRERPILTANTFQPVGITPACAGKTRKNHLSNAFQRDHPRVCGKDNTSNNTIIIRSGSPPRVRERRKGGKKKKDEKGITPACAGKTCPVSERLSARRDHPRVCGKDKIVVDRNFQRKGSPPRVRERRKKWNPFFRSKRITPACAGKTTR